jgi:hypothetical protein
MSDKREKEPIDFPKAEAAAELTRLFMTDEEQAIIDLGLKVWSEKVDELRAEAIQRGWNPSDDDATARIIEDRASQYVEETVQGYSKASEKEVSLFMSALRTNQDTSSEGE